MDQIQMVFTARVLIVGMGLLAGSVMDIRTRRIKDSVWILMMFSGLPLLGFEMWLKGGGSSWISLLSLLLPLMGFLFVLFGYPEPGEVLRGSAADISFLVIYSACITGSILGFVRGDPALTYPVAFSSLFMLIYFGLYHIPVGGTRIIHGGADLKCLLVLAALFPWYGSDLPFALGPFYRILSGNTLLAWIFPIHLSVLFNGAFITTILLLLALPALNLIRGDLAFPRIFTSYRTDVRGMNGKHVWVYVERNGKREKVEPTGKLESRLLGEGTKRVWVTPKIPFIFSLFLGFLVQMTAGNLVALIFLAI